MSSQQLDNPAVRCSNSSKVPRVIITSDDNGTENVAAYIGQIPTTDRAVYRTTYDNGASYRFRPSPNSFRDPFAHAILNPRPAGERCSIMYCEYCALCERYQIESHALQSSLIPEGANSPRWDPFFHWYLNEQIPNLHFGDMGPGSRNWSTCWISHCPCREFDLDTDQTSTAPNGEFLGCPCKRLRTSDNQHNHTCCDELEPYTGNQEVGYVQARMFPFQVCPRYQVQRPIQGRHNIKCCVHCFAMQKIQEKGMAYLDIRFTRRENDHNDTLFRRIGYALSPLAVDPDLDAGSRRAREDYETMFFNLPDWALRGYRKPRFQADDELPRRGRREGKPWTRARCPSPYPEVNLEHVHDIDVEEFDSDSCLDCRDGDTAFYGQNEVRTSSRRRCLPNFKNTPRRWEPSAGQNDPRSSSTSPSSMVLTTCHARSCTTPAQSEAAEKALQALPYGRPSSHTAEGAQGGNSSFQHSPKNDDARPQCQVERLTAEEERFRIWIDDVEGYHYRGAPSRVTREHISFWRQVKIICGLEEDPNCCEHCELDKAACECLVQQGDGSWVMG